MYDVLPSGKIDYLFFNLTGSHYFDSGEGSKVVLNFYDTNNTIVDTFTFVDVPPGTFSGASAITLQGGLKNPPKLGSYSLTLTTASGNACCYYSFDNMNLLFTLVINEE